MSDPDHKTPHWLGNGQAIASIFVVASTVMMYPSNINPSFDARHAILIDIADSTITTFAYSWTDDLGRLPDVRSVPGSTRSTPYGMARLASANASEIAGLIGPLMDFASKAVPAEQHTDTRLKVFSTAVDGSAEARAGQEAALQLFGEFVSNNYEFQVATARVHASEKALLGWLALNQARGYLSGLLASSTDAQRLGAIDLDGRSATIAFLPDHGTFYERSNIHSVLLGGSKLHVVTAEFANTGTQAVESAVETLQTLFSRANVCAPGSGQYSDCEQAVSAAVSKTCGNSDSFGQLLSDTQFVATGLLSLPHSFYNLTAKAPLSAVTRAAKGLCSDWQESDIKASVLHEKDLWPANAQLTVTCFLPAYVTSLLSTVFGVAADQAVIEFSQRAADNLSWTLGSCLFDAWGGVLSIHGHA